MKYKFFAMNSNRALSLLFFIAFVSLSQAQLSVPFEPRLPGDNMKVKGDLVYVANNIVSIASNPNADYNGSSSNQNVTMNYIDIDGDPSTFSSSSAELNAPSCSAVVYAGLYWGGIYRDTNRDDPYKQVKFKIPGGSYVDIGPNSDPEFQYEQIYDKDGDRDGDGVTDPGIVDVDYLSGVNMTSYLNYANVTHLLSGLSDPNGEYTVANVVASTAESNVSAGWTMVVIYENQNSTSKYISTFDGYAAMGSTYSQTNVPFSGFKTVPAPLPVNAVIGASTIDGDRINGPSMRFRANPTDSWTYLSDAINPSNNVFNSTISHLGSWVDTRTPASRNTLGWDADILNLPNAGNSVLPNDHDSGEVLISTSSEGVILFLTTVAVEIINPEIIVEKKVKDLVGNDITGDGVNLGQSLEYVLRFWNRGNDDATNFTIRDVLPDNVNLNNIDLSGAPGVTMTTSGTDPEEIIFQVPDGLVTQGGNTYEIIIRVEVSDNCHDFVAACSSTIHNTAYSTYDGVTSNQTISNDPSVSNVNSCGFVTNGATNFLLDDLTDCVFESEIQICGASAEITAGQGYDTYTWYRDLNENGQIDATDTVYTDGDADNDPTTVTVTETGFYLVRKESASCGTNIESVEVTRFGTTQVNPIITYFNTLNGDADITNDIQGEIVTCANDGSQLPQIFLCGTNDTQDIVLNITDAQAIRWEKLDEASCAATNPDCPNTQMGCTWNQVDSGNSFTADTGGRYRLVLSYAGGCNSIFYFDVFQNNLDFDYDTQNIFCSTDGHIRIKNVGSGYGYQLVDTSSETVLVSYADNNGPNFNISTPGTYRVDFTQLDPITGDPLDGSCVFSTEEIGIQRRDLSINLTTNPVTCLGQGSVRIQATQARANYGYVLYEDDGSGNPGTFVNQNLANANSDFTFANLNAGDYVVVVRTDDGCEETESFTIDEIPDPVVTASTTKQITCTDGTIALNASQGDPSPSYLYAIWEKNGSTSYSDISDIPSIEFQRDTIAPGVFNFPSGEQGTYRFVVVDGNNCWSLSNEVAINDLGGLTVAAPTIDSEITCEGSNTGQVTMNVSGSQTPYTYSIDDWATQQSDPTFVNLSPGTYTIRVRSADGCEDNTTFTLDDPETFKANAGISSTGTCDVNGNSEVRFTNVEGGTGPYEFSFDGGSSFIADDPMDPSVRIGLLPPGNHVLVARDARGCQITLPITIDPPLPIPNFDLDLAYDCDGNGNVVLTPDQGVYDYSYTINTSPSATTSTDGTFTGIAPGTYTITAEYAESDPPNPSVLLLEDFGSGPTVDSPYVLGYTYEDQVGSNTQINDFEYSITSYIVSPFGPWIRPTDHTSGGSDSNGRYLVINVGSPAPGQIIYQKPIKDIIPNQDMRISFAAINLLGSGSQLDPDIYVQMRIPGTSTVIGEVQTNDIPKNRIWNTFDFTINPGVHTELDFILISKKIGNSGNDVAIDDILVEQVPESCPRTMDIPVVIEAGNGFGATVIGHTDISCNGANDGSITFEVENFDATAGFEYSIDGGSNWIASTTSPVTTATTLSGGTQSVIVRKADDTSCSITLNQDIDEPAVLAINANILQNPSCNDPLGSIEATVTGGTPTYQYALEDGVGGSIVAFPNPTGNTFNGLAAGDYVIVARDISGCEVRSAIITLDAPDTLAYDVDYTSCYDGGNNASIDITVTSGNGGYLFQIDGGPWQSPDPSTPDSYTFSGLANGTYDINVKDAFGCEDVVTQVTIDAQLLVNVTATDVSSCADGAIEVSASGGTPTYEYAFVPTGGDPTGLFSLTDNFSVASGNEGDYDVYVRDNSGTGLYCEYIETVTINPATPLTMSATPSDPQCHDGKGNILIDITSGISPYTIQIIDVDNGGASNRTDTNVLATSRTYYNLSPGNYTINITDATGCTITDTQTLNNPDELTADTLPILPSNCDPDPNLYGFEFDNYPLTLDGTLEFSGDGGLTWQTSDTFMGAAFASGTTVNPAIRTVDGSNNVICERDLPSFIMPYPLDDLDITISAIIVDCNELQVTVQGEEGLAPYEYAYSEDPANFDPTTATWIPGENIDNEGFSVPAGHGKFTWTGLVPGRTYVFYVKDDSGTDGCTRQSTVNVNNIAPPPVSITSEVTPSCGGLDNGQITYTITEDTPGQLGGTFDWELFEISNTSVPVSSGTVSGFTSGDSFTTPTAPLSGLAPGTYYVEIQGAAPNNCFVGSENAILAELDPMTGTLNVLEDISCNNPGLIEVQNPTGGGGIYTYTVTGPGSFSTITATSDNPIEIPANSPAGTYTVEINDQYGDCPVSLGTVHLDLAPNPVIDGVSVENCTMPAMVRVNSSSPNILYSIDGGTTYLNNGGVFNGITPGTYIVAIIDDNGCSATQSVTVHPSLQANAQLTKLIDCSSTPDGTIEIKALQGSGSYDYSVENLTTSLMEVSKTSMGGNSIEFHPATAGDYEIKVYVDATTDHEACERTFTIVVPDPIEPDFTATPTDVSCNGANDGSIAVRQTDNGITPLTYELLDSGLTPIPSGDFSWDSATRTFNDLAPGDYVVRATGTNDCTTDIVVPTINEPTPITVTIPAADVVQFGCAAGNNPDNASITVNATSISGGTGTYVRYEFVNPSSNVVQDGNNNRLIISNRTGGVYTINVYDNTGCVGTTTATIQQFDELQDATINVDYDISCANGGETITITAQGLLSDSTTGPHDYEFEEISTGNTNAVGTFTGLQVGLHSFRVTNTDTGCSMVVTHNVEEIEQFQINMFEDAPVVCAGDDAQYRFELTGGYSGGFTWTVFNTNGTLSDTSDDTQYGPLGSGTGTTSGNIDLPKGTYRVEVVQTDFPFCTEETTVTVGGADAVLDAAITEIGNASCANDQGRLSVTPTGGIAPYTISIPSLGISQTNVYSYVFTNLTDGTYTIEVTDAAGCTNATLSGTIQTVDPLLADITPATQTLDCIGDSDGSITATLTSGGVGTVLYSLNRIENGSTVSTSSTQTSSTFNNLSAGTYSINISDDAGCTVTTTEVVINDPTPVRANLVMSRSLTCDTDAQLTLTVTGGTPFAGNVYQFSTSESGPYTAMSGGNTHVFDVSASTDPYQYYVIDANGCDPVLSSGVTVIDVVPLTAVVDENAAYVTCNGESTASISVDADGGLGNYVYGLYQDSAMTIPVAPTNSNGYFDGLAQGTYYAGVISGDCEWVSGAINITEPAPLAITSDVTDVTCMGADDGSIVLNVSGGTAGYQYAISPNLNQFVDEGTFTDLAAGDYTVIVQDANGCFEVLDFTITQPDALTVTSTAEHEICFGSEDGLINLEVQGGTAPYSTSLNSSQDENFVEGQMSYGNLASGDYVVFIRDANGCMTTEIVTINPGVNLEGTVEVVYECDGDSPTNYLDINFEDQSVVADLLYGLDSNDPNDMVLTPDFTNLAPGQHTLTVAHANGCDRTFTFEVEGFDPLTLELSNDNINEITATVTGGNPDYTFEVDGVSYGNDNTFLIRETATYAVTVTDENGCSVTQEIFMEFIDIEIPNFFTPDGDGLNDTWKPRNIEVFPNITISIFDRYGRTIYKMLQDTDPWDGFYNQADLPTGDYWYIIKLNGDEDTREFVGHFTLYR
ncbi:T9SS type B sorting domain-containing protein [Muricauda sp. HICW]|uniref:T9SS type B sorting domain-containing protein n=1 Tax=Flagellimonas chongwuensis TaxID=2697365 RepID=A0A850NQ68_9FLAO|nr:T9SS type B sorting domain-containing protein [Allomuricauda chongwuensis]NVN19457.1 T9SS type B sorting domain-containing protein [Allomuricauda chongwuensis]